MGSGEDERPATLPDRILLVGFMGSGKTSVGRKLARRLGWTFRDFDDEVVKEAGMQIPEIFSRFGEPRFRQMEAEVARRLLREREVVLASGGGWAAAEGRLEALPKGTAAVWLRVSPGTAVKRARRDGATRPLLEVDDPAARARELLEERKDAYATADLSLDSEADSPGALAERIAGTLGFAHGARTAQEPNASE